MPYTELAKARDEAVAHAQGLELEVEELRARLRQYEGGGKKG